MKQKPLKKLQLGKKTLTRLGELETQNAAGGSYTSISVAYTRNCMTDITRPPVTSYQPGTSY